jgi:aspartyl-tRNA(Asn)/glutamyl-tRNA(Gln) amidotransferase subunit C
MPIDRETIKKVANLARLELSEDEEVQLAKDAEQILGWIKQMEEVDTTDVVPMTHIHKNTNDFRSDVPHNDLSRENALKNAPAHDGEYVLVNKVL